ncbi:protein AKNAD1 [Suncus etruscus]|uniref:protein AKNAD1 n=1 Tax=Suncus etruscus TaxID=109475 RepID=UPI00210F531C|nr:protein AKNAD1 [Suncus etruscus]
MDEADFSEDRTSQQQEDLPYDGDFTQIKIYSDCNFTSKNDIHDAPNKIISTICNPQEKNPPKRTYGNVGLSLVPNIRIDNTVNNISSQEKWNATHLHPLGDKEGSPKTNISSILLHHFSKEEVLNGQGIACKTIPETSQTDSHNEAVIKSSFLHDAKKSQLKEPFPELSNQSRCKRNGENRNDHSCSPSMTEENPTVLGGAVATKDWCNEENSNFLTQIKIQTDKQKCGQGQALQKQKTEEASSGSGFKYGQGQVHDLGSNCPKVPPKANSPQNNKIDGSLTVDKQIRFTPTLRNKLAIVQDILESMARLNCTEKHEQKKEAMIPLGQTQVESTVHFHQEHPPGMDSDISPFKVSSAGHRNVSLNSSYIFQKIYQGCQMCQKLKEQTDQLRTKVEEFSKTIAQDSSHHLQDRKQILENLQDFYLKFPEQEVLASEKEQLTSQQQLVYKHEYPAVNNCDPERQHQMEKKGHRKIHCDRLPGVDQEKALHSDSNFSSDMGHDCCSVSGTVVQSNECKDCAIKLHHPQGFYSKETSKAGSKSKWICSQRANSKSYKDEYELIPEKKYSAAFLNYSSDPAILSPHSHSCTFSGSRCLCSVSSIKETDPEVLNMSLGHAMRTAAILKETTNQMIKTIAEDLAKVQRRRSQLKTQASEY